MRSNDYPGTFIVLEGADGCGTTTQVKALAERLQAQGYPVLATAEPSGGPVGILLRKYLGGALPQPNKEQLCALLTLLFSADRIEHLAHEVEPALKKGYVVLCDRYVLSTFAYQTDALDEFEWIAMVSRKALQPDVTVIIHIDPKTGMKRLEERSGRKEIYEKLAVQEKVADNYTRLSHFPVGVVLSVNGDNEKNLITDKLVALVRPYIKTLRDK